MFNTRFKLPVSKAFRDVSPWHGILSSSVITQYSKEFASKINDQLIDGYNRRFYEPRLVALIEGVVNGLNNFTLRDRYLETEISTKSIFIHGSKSFVEFDYYGQTATRELGDLIFIVTLVVDGKKIAEKYTINQFKKDRVRTNPNWDLKNKEQLFLLSRFPVFKGVSGSLIPQREFRLQDETGTLGSYGLLYSPGDFIYIGAAKLNSVVGLSSTVSLNQLSKLNNIYDKYSSTYVDAFGPGCWYTSNTFDFANELLKFRIGEPVHFLDNTFNVSAQELLFDILRLVRLKGGLFNDFVDHFLKYDYHLTTGEDVSPPIFDDNILNTSNVQGGIGIVHTTINFGRSRD